MSDVISETERLARLMDAEAEEFDHLASTSVLPHITTAMQNSAADMRRIAALLRAGAQSHTALPDTIREAEFAAHRDGIIDAANFFSRGMVGLKYDGGPVPPEEVTEIVMGTIQKLAQALRDTASGAARCYADQPEGRTAVSAYIRGLNG
jgi:hypothetical protein